MRTKTYLMLALCLIVGVANAQKKKKKEDIDAIMSMCGCYDIDFNFAETFASDTAYEFHKNYSAGALEWVFPIQQEDDKIMIQHLLVVNDTMIIKHWRQDWEYENTDMYVFDVRSKWNYKNINVEAAKGQWTQKVFQVDDSPRYAASATWVHVDGRHYWESIADAPLPRREKTKRNDYNVMVRRNRQEITNGGWVHEQDNQKVKRKDGTDTEIAREKGWNEYKKVEDSDCNAAKEWWDKNQVFWADVRTVWDEVFATKKTLELKMRAGDEVLMMRLFGLGKELVKEESYNSENAKQKIREAIQIHMVSDIKLASN